VFFIRHNGGNVWVDPPLGWPWPKHSCFSFEPKGLDFIRTKVAGIPPAQLLAGIVTKAAWSRRGTEPPRMLLAIDGGAGARMCVAVRAMNTAAHYDGCFAVVDLKAATLFTSNFGEEPILGSGVAPADLGLPRSWAERPKAKPARRQDMSGAKDTKQTP
jgi:hypothetical protein